ncbi:esterase [Alicyclobacillus cycloheptanicus]|uniref:Enterochelin esterase-like enzyme n=1 Tax=Alicyclobacillus cycloheptanicus TaxID=1457 RepID=A0ABT9XKQ4_9BACL|nr:alpha/beta hydrolase-fold protein [Alicyclobacillus cycloheptanicus]MDQ0190887.1 enterochelin esterase-like enzyme [Alicyclobacillus cycloheptanicus]WDM01773.1 esterase [Alicyclobacillus cycloheptanicus]
MSGKSLVRRVLTGAAVLAAASVAAGCGLVSVISSHARTWVASLPTLQTVVSQAASTGRALTADASIRHLTLYSAALHADMKVDVYLPPGYSAAKRYPVLYLLHGKDGNQDSWMSPVFGDGIDVNLAATRMIRNHQIAPLIIVTPEIDNSYGLNTSKVRRQNVGGYSRGMYETWLDHDLIHYIDAHFSTIPTASGRYIGGYSMGGFAALHLAFTHPNLYSKAGVMSAALWVGGLPEELAWIYPTPAEQAERDPITYAEHHPLHVPVAIIEGTDDPFYYADERLAAVLRQQDTSQVIYRTYPGAHDQTFWRAHAAELLRFFAGTS